MTLLPSPIPHPLDYSPWELPGWAYEALDWVVGVEWPEGDERAVWNLADQWYAVARALAGPRDDAIAAAAEVRNGYGAIGAVAEAFDTAWRRVAEGDEAPLPVLLAVSNDLGRLVEECGCDIEGAKLEVWIELGILVIELLSLAVAAALTAGAASAAAGPVIAASRMVIQRIFRQLMAQMGRKALRQGLKEAGERAAKETVEGGAAGLGRRALRGGLSEAGEEAGVSLATQTYQNSTGRREGLDLAELGTSAVGGLAGGAVAPLAGLGRHATGRGARIGEHFAREMTGEVLAEGAARLATGQGAMSLEDAARAAVSGSTGSAASQADAALHARLDARLQGLAGSPPAPLDLSVPPPAVSTGVPSSDGPTSADTGVESGPPTHIGSGDSPAAAAASVYDGHDLPARVTARPLGDVGDALPPTLAHGHGAPLSAAGGETPTATVGTGAAPTLPSVAADPVAGVSGAVEPVPEDGFSLPTATAHHAPAPQVAGAPPTPSDPTLAGNPTTGVQAAAPVNPATPSPVATAGAAGTASGTVPTTGVPAVSGSPYPAPVRAAYGGTPVFAPAPTSQPPPLVGTGPPPERGTGVPEQRVDGANAPRTSRFPSLEVLAPGPATSSQPQTRPARLPRPAPETGESTLRPRTPEWYAARWAADREALERRRYQGYFDSQRAWYEDKRRTDAANRRKVMAQNHELRSDRFAEQAVELEREGRTAMADWLRVLARRERGDVQDEQQLAADIMAGRVVPDEVLVDDAADFRRINDDVADLALGAVETADRSALTGDDDPPPIDRSRRYGQWGGLRPPLALHQTDLERQMPRNPDGSVVRTADPRHGGWFALANDGGSQADPTRGINCLDCTLSLFETWVHGRPRVSAPRTFDGYLEGDIRRPILGEKGGPGRVEEATGGRFQKLVAPRDGEQPGPAQLRHSVDRGFGNLHDQLLIGGHGSFAFLITEWEDGGSHAWVALNQNGTILYLDPQSGLIHDRPLYAHRGVRHPDNVVGIDALVLGRDGRPMPLGGLARGRFSVLPDLPQYPSVPDDEAGYGDPYLNRLHLLEDSSPSSPAQPDAPTGVSRSGGNDERGDSGDAQDRLRRARNLAASRRIAAGVGPSDLVVASGDLESLFAAGVAPAEAAVHLDGPALSRLAPHLDSTQANDVAHLLADARVVSMLDETWQTPPRGEAMLAETLVWRLAQRPELARMILSTPELMSALTARPATLHHLTEHDQAVGVLGSTLDEIAVRGPVAVAAGDPPVPRATPLTVGQRSISEQIRSRRQPVFQPGFDLARMHETRYREDYIDRLYDDADVAQRELNQLASFLAGERGRPGWRAQRKGYRRVLDKLVEYDNDASKLKDLAGAKIQFDRLEDVYEALRQVGEMDGVVVLDLKDRFIKPQLSGYRDLLLNLRMSNGHVAELRLHLAAVDRVALWEHALYQVRRDLLAIAEAEGRALTPMESAVCRGLLKREQEAFWLALRNDEGMG